jgi:hypothetical protein
MTAVGAPGVEGAAPADGTTTSIDPMASRTPRKVRGARADFWANVAITDPPSVELSQ